MNTASQDNLKPSLNTNAAGVNPAGTNADPAQVANPQEASPPVQSRRGCARGGCGCVTGCLTLLLLLLAVLSLLALWAYWKWHKLPAHWVEARQKIQQLSVEQQYTVGDALERRIVDTLTRHIPAGSSGGTPNPENLRSLDIPLLEVNAWLATRLEVWLTNQNIRLPASVRAPTVSVVEGQLALSFEYLDKNLQQVFTLYFLPEVLPNGQATLTFTGVTGGQLPIPFTDVPGRVQQAIPPAQSAALKPVTDALEGRPFDPIFELDRRRELRLISLTLTPEQIHVIVSVEAKQAP